MTKPYVYRDWIIRPDMLESLQAYVEKRRPVGDFLTAALENDLVRACSYADDDNLNNIPAFAAWLYNECPSRAWGSPEKVRAWLIPHEVIDEVKRVVR